MNKPSAPHINDYPFTLDIDTRWHDNDVYGHVNNVVYYNYFDSIANRYLIDHADLDIHKGQQIGLMVSSQCFYHQSVAFPDKLTGALRVNRLGNSSVEYGLAIFKSGQDIARAQGNITHVFVDRETQKPMPINGKLREALAAILRK